MGDISKIQRMAAIQYGVFSRKQARRAGFSKYAVRNRIANGEWLKVDDAVYAVSSAPASWEGRLQTALLSRDRGALTHVTACRVFGLSGFAKQRPVLLVPRGSNVRSSAARLIESDQFEAIATTKVDNFVVTTMPETILVLARDFRGARLTEIFDEAVVSGKLDLRAMASTIDREAGRRTPGTPQLRRLTSTRMPGAPSQSASYLERLLEMILSDSRLPFWTREYEFSLSGVPARVDVFIPSARLVIEADGRNWHTKWEDFESDRRRDNALAARGVQVLRFTYEMLTNEPELCLQQAIDTSLIRAA